MSRIMGLLAALVALLGGAAHAGAVKLDSSADYGLIAVEVEPGGPMAAANGGYTLNIARFSPQEHAATANSFGGWASLTGVGKMNQDRTYYLAKAKPGSYAVLSLSVKAWGVCYNGDTRTFDVKAGEVTYVGRYDPRDSLTELSQAVRSGRLPSMAKVSDINFLFDTSRVALVPPEQLEPWRREFEAWLKSEHPGVTAPIVAAPITATHFNTGRDALGLRRICGGYYAKKDKTPTDDEKAPQPPSGG
jgi:hypothetical protein